MTQPMERRGQKPVLLIAYHYPPCATSSGVQRSLSFSVHLPKSGWRPVVLTVHPGSYERTSLEQLGRLPSDLTIARTFALDSARHLAIGGRYWSRLAVPDRWRSWWLTAVPKGLQLIRKHDVAAIWSTYPIATAHAVGATLARLTGRPWIADFRDPMVEYVQETKELFPKDPALRAARLRIEQRAARSASRMVFCTEAARTIVQERYPFVDRSKLAVISNGYDEDAFGSAGPHVRRLRLDGRRVLVHSGTVYPGADRDPSALMRAVRMLADQGALRVQDLEVRLRDPSNEDYFRNLSVQFGVQEFFSILPPVPYVEALAEMMSADALLLLQGYTSNPAIPAKFYEYLRAGKPILGLVHADGETARSLRELKIDSVAPLTDVERIGALIKRWLHSPLDLEARLPSRDIVASYARERLTESLAGLLDDAIR
jgi:glycosyltransferase involved in cell wall biosynthesis